MMSRRSSSRLILLFILLANSTVLALLPLSWGSYGWASVALFFGGLQSLCMSVLFWSFGHALWRALRSPASTQRLPYSVAVPARVLQVVVHHEWVLTSEGAMICPECKRLQSEGHGTDCQWGRSLGRISQALARHTARGEGR